MIVKLLTEHHLEFLSLKGGCRGSSESTLVKMSNCWKSHATAQLLHCNRRVIVKKNMYGPTYETFILIAYAQKASFKHPYRRIQLGKKSKS